MADHGREAIVGDGRAGRIIREAVWLVRRAGLSAVSILAARLVTALTGIWVVSCLHRTAAPVARASAARRLTPEELEQVSADPALDLPPEFIATAGDSTCYGVVRDQRVRAYAWMAGAGSTPIGFDCSVRMPEDLAYVYKAFTDPKWRGQGLFAECMSAIGEEAAGRVPPRDLAAIADAQNHASQLAFRRAGFRRCGYVVLVPWARRAFIFNCTHTTPCTWTYEGAGGQRPRSAASQL